MLALTTYDRVQILHKIIAELNQPPFATQLDHTERLHALELEAKVSLDPENTAAAYRAAIAKAPADRWLHYQYGKFLDPYEPPAAAYEYRKVLAILPEDFPQRGTSSRPRLCAAKSLRRNCGVPQDLAEYPLRSLGISDNGLRTGAPGII